MSTQKVETIRMSSKGQIVIPIDIREAVHAEEGTLFAVEGKNNTIVLQKLETPSKEELIAQLKSMSREGKKRLEALGIKESDIPDIVKRHHVRRT